MLRGKNGETCWPSQPKTKKKNEITKERGDPLCSDIPEWLQEFTENLVDCTVPERRDSHASSSHEPSLEPTPARSANLGKPSVYTHFPKDRNCEICQRTKITRAPCRRRKGEAVPRADNFGDLLQQITKFSVKVVNLETIIDMKSSCRTSPPNGSSRIRAKQKLLRRHKGACKSSWSRIGSIKSFTLTIPWNMAKPVKKIFPGIVVRLHHTDRRLMVLPKEQCAE